MDPIVHVREMELEIRRCALALLPELPNARLEYETTASAPNQLGEPSGPITVQGWDIRLFWPRFKPSRGRWTPAGIVPDSSNDCIFAPPSGLSGFAPQLGHIVREAGQAWRIESLRTLPIDDHIYYEATVSRLRA